MITTHILCKNNQETIKKTLDSILPLEGKIIIGNLGSTDDTLAICKEHGCRVISFKGDRSEIRNNLAKESTTEWQFYLEPGEELSGGHDLFYDLKGCAKRVYVVQDNMISKEARIWNKEKFINPVHEYLDGDTEPINIFISGYTVEDQLEGLLEWKKKSPQAAEVDYYLACQYLIRKEYDKFLRHADLFLFRDGRTSQPTILMHYYLAQVWLHVKKNSQEAIRHILYCLAEKPLMSEFWCFLGDSYYKAGVPRKSREFFEVSKKMGKSRPTDDAYPIELAKYGEYPDKMIELCNELDKLSQAR